MKNRIIALICAVIFAALPLSALAEDIPQDKLASTRRYELDEIGVTIELPSRYFVVTTATTQSELDANGLEDLDASLWVQSLYDSDTYLEAVDFTGNAGGLFAQISPSASPESSVYVSYYPYEEIEAELAYDESLGREEWLLNYYTNSSISAELAAMGITYTPDGTREFADREWTRLIYSSAANSSDGIEYFLPMSDGELVVCIFSGTGATLTESDIADFESMMSSITVDEPEPFNYSPIIICAALLLSVALLVFIVKANKR